MADSDTFYQDLQTEVDEILAELGTVYTVRAEGTYDPDELEVSTGATREVTGLVATQQVVNNLAAIAFPVTEVSVAWTARKTLILAADAAPQPGEEVQVDSEWFPLSKVVAVKPADVVVVYLLDVTR
jgi:hypothetical protein